MNAPSVRRIWAVAAQVVINQCVQNALLSHNSAEIVLLTRKTRKLVLSQAQQDPLLLIHAVSVKQSLGRPARVVRNRCAATAVQLAPPNVDCAALNQGFVQSALFSQ